MKKQLLLCVLAIAVVGCSPDEKSIRKAVEKGDYLYVEKYLNNPKYWTDYKKYEINAAALEALILLNRIDSAVKIFKENKEDSAAEGRIVKAFINGLKKSNLQKVPEKIVELINDDRNNDSDDLLRSVVVELEPSVVATKVKTYIEQAISTRKKEGHLDGSIIYNSPVFLKKAEMWDITNTYGDHIKVIKNHYSELDRLNKLLTENNSKLVSKQISLDYEKTEVSQRDVAEAQENLNDLYTGNPYNLSVNGCLQLFSHIGFLTKGKKTPYSVCREEYIERLKKAKEPQQNVRTLQAEIKDIEKTILDNVSQVKAIQTETDNAEANLLAALVVASQESK